MANCYSRPIPAMHTLKSVGEKRKQWYLDHQFKKLTEIVGSNEETEFLFDSAEIIDFLFLIRENGARGLRIYFGSYLIGDESTPPEKDNKLTLIFAPVGEANADLGDYYIINANRKIILDRNDLANDFVKSYQDLKLPELNKLRDAPELGDTKSVLYRFPALLNFRDEILCQNASGVKIFIVSITDSETVSARLKRRLTLSFGLTRKNGATEVEFFIEDDAATFEHRSKLTVRHEKAFAGDFDTGSPCPPASCPGSSLPKP